ncbi:MAG: hypothetical protein Q9208_003436 [Pyrenodesmia sp. 3 TL-2023]
MPRCPRHPNAPILDRKCICPPPPPPSRTSSRFSIVARAVVGSCCLLGSAIFLLQDWVSKPIDPLLRIIGAIPLIFALFFVALFINYSRLEYRKPRAARAGDMDAEQGAGGWDDGCGGQADATQEALDGYGDEGMSVQLEKRIERLDWSHREILGALLEKVEKLEGLQKDG